MNPVKFQDKRALITTCSCHEKDNSNSNFFSSICPIVVSKVTIISAPLGMSLDNYHGLFNVLNYESIGHPFQWSIDDTVVLKSALWVPFLFSFAGFAMSIIALTTEKANKFHDLAPSWANTLYSIALFSFQYYISGALDSIGTNPFIIHIALATLSVLGFFNFDKTFSGLILSVLTALIGPITEIGLVNVGHLYTYTHADFYGVCSWIPWVYLLGGSAVGNLSRSLYCDEARQYTNVRNS